MHPRSGQPHRESVLFVSKHAFPEHTLLSEGRRFGSAPELGGGLVEVQIHYVGQLRAFLGVTREHEVWLAEFNLSLSSGLLVMLNTSADLVFCRAGAQIFYIPTRGCGT
uniref:AraC family transcriptional regulator n=1 Tax=Ascaris lumbricoides TaxID=6252 RepID=A0A0M3HUS9_ASCLU